MGVTDEHIASIFNVKMCQEKNRSWQVAITILVDFRLNTQLYIPADKIHHYQCFENLMPCPMRFLSQSTPLI
jgi:hypothetical protein